MGKEINDSGIAWEKEVKLVLEQSKHGFKRLHKCDYEVYTDEPIPIGVEAKGQSTIGTADEKLPFTVWKYGDTYKKLIICVTEEWYDNEEWGLQSKKGQLILENIEFNAKIKKCKVIICRGLDNLAKNLEKLPQKKEENILNFLN
tara:strand:+ start:544 stop:978 length:435 start_codon:yes stop_codon:yes gene_type:complete